MTPSAGNTRLKSENLCPPESLSQLACSGDDFVDSTTQALAYMRTAADGQIRFSSAVDGHDVIDLCVRVAGAPDFSWQLAQLR